MCECDQLRRAIDDVAVVARRLGIGPAAPLCIIERNVIQIRRPSVEETVAQVLGSCNAQRGTNVATTLILKSLGMLHDGKRSAFILFGALAAALLDEWEGSFLFKHDASRATLSAAVGSADVINAIDSAYCVAVRKVNEGREGIPARESALKQLFASVLRTEVTTGVGEVLAQLATELLASPFGAFALRFYTSSDRGSFPFVAAVRGQLSASRVADGLTLRSDRVGSIQRHFPQDHGRLLVLGTISTSETRLAAAQDEASSSSDEETVEDTDQQKAKQRRLEECLLREILDVAERLHVNLIVTSVRLPDFVVRFCPAKGVVVVDVVDAEDLTALSVWLGLQGADLTPDGLTTWGRCTAEFCAVYVLDRSTMIVNPLGDGTAAKTIVLRTPIAELGAEYVRLLLKLLRVAGDFATDAQQLVPGGCALWGAFKKELDQVQASSVEARKVLRCISTALMGFIAGFAEAQVRGADGSINRRCTRRIFERFVVPMIAADECESTQLNALFVDDSGALNVVPASRIGDCCALVERAYLVHDVTKVALSTVQQLLRVAGRIEHNRDS